MPQNLLIFLLLALLGSAVVFGASNINKQCRDLLQCSVQRKCVNLPELSKLIENQTISSKMYDDIDKHTDYGCIFTTGCQDECNDCPLCLTSKLQIVDILSGEKSTGDCPALMDCALKCVDESNQDIFQINKCLRHDCAFHCFDGSCPKCSGFVTRVFNQMCAAGNFRQKIRDFSGPCYEMFHQIVHAKFAERFDKAEAEAENSKKS
ncbi:unnamed protein product [Caenorhabditis angaria]|uniref:DUF19 domain-containing protein n=1 Tax=Caenorhabditis angaria TaxID=860376 RepID=A0A9P1N6U0_9PELO|nr:unnamed protein product [Caenorhabditis angaria]